MALVVILAVAALLLAALVVVLLSNERRVKQTAYEYAAGVRGFPSSPVIPVRAVPQELRFDRDRLGS